MKKRFHYKIKRVAVEIANIWKITMHIGLIKKSFNMNGGGAEKYTAYIISGLISRGHKITMLSEKCEIADNPGGYEKIDFNTFRIKENLYWTRVNKGFGFSGTYTFHRQVQKVLKKKSFDVVYAVSRTYPVDVLRVTEQLNTIWMKINYSRLHYLNPRHISLLKLEKKIFLSRNTGVIVTNSELIKRQVMEIYRYPEHRIKVLRNGIDRKKFFPLTSQEEKDAIRKKYKIDTRMQVLLFVAANFKIKGLYQAIKTLSKLKSSLPLEKGEKLLLIVVGGDNPEPFMKYARRLGVRDNVVFLGKQNEIREFYVAADILFYPTLYEPFANVCMEACACGLPVLTTAQNGASELITHGVNGYIVDTAESVPDMQKYLYEFIALPPQKRRLLSENAIQAVKNFSWEVHIDQLEKIFSALECKNFRDRCI